MSANKSFGLLIFLLSNIWQAVCQFGNQSIIILIINKVFVKMFHSIDDPFSQHLNMIMAAQGTAHIITGWESELLSLVFTVRSCHCFVKSYDTSS